MTGAGGAAGKTGTGGATAGAGGAGGHGGPTGAAGTAGGGASGAAGGSGNRYMPCPTTTGTACAILPLGDSITEGWLPTGGVGGYRVELFSKAVLANKNITFVGSQTSSSAPNTVQNQTFPKKHEGHDGYTIDTGSGNSGISGSITDQAMSNYHPNIVLLMIGTNDVNGNIDVANAPTRLGKLIDEITTDSPTALVVVASIIPINGTNNKNAMTYNAAIPGLVSTRATAGKHVIFVDNYAAFSKDANYTTTEMSNYLHPNTAGYAVLGDSFFGAISDYLP
jgi:lysophospholipase L1-like esterase